MAWQAACQPAANVLSPFEKELICGRECWTSAFWPCDGESLCEENLCTGTTHLVTIGGIEYPVKNCGNAIPSERKKDPELPYFRTNFPSPTGFVGKMAAKFVCLHATECDDYCFQVPNTNPVEYRCHKVSGVEAVDDAIHNVEVPDPNTAACQPPSYP
ncbi:MAG: hypothetical protein ACOYOZ_11935 [Pirellula sp.]